MIYTSLDNPRMREFKKLHQKKYRDQSGLFLVEGAHLVEEAYQAGALETLILKEGETSSFEGETIYVSDALFSSLSLLETPQGVIGVCRKKEPRKVEGNVFLLEDIQDPGNLGTIIRSAVAFHIDTLILSPHCVDIYNEKVIRASQGMIFHLNFLVCDLKEILPSLKKLGYSILGTRVTHGKDIKTIEKNLLFAIIMGNEGNGMSEEIGEFCDDFVYIDMSRECESLNVGVAASILMYELGK